MSSQDVNISKGADSNPLPEFELNTLPLLWVFFTNYLVRISSIAVCVHCLLPPCCAPQEEPHSILFWIWEMRPSGHMEVSGVIHISGCSHAWLIITDQPCK